MLFLHTKEFGVMKSLFKFDIGDTSPECIIFDLITGLDLIPVGAAQSEPIYM